MAVYVEGCDRSADLTPVLISSLAISSALPYYITPAVRSNVTENLEPPTSVPPQFHLKPARHAFYYCSVCRSPHDPRVPV